MVVQGPVEDAANPARCPGRGAVPLSLKLAIGVGIGLFITLVGLREGGIVVNDPATGIGLGDLTAGPPLIALAGLAVAIVLAARNVSGALIIGVLASVALGLDLRRAGGPGRRRADPRAATTSRRSATRSTRPTSPTRSPSR